jgi:hypothetical protein
MNEDDMSAQSRHEKRRAKERRGFRILLWVPCLFLMAQVLGGLVLDYVWVRPRYPMKADMFAHLKARKQPPEVLFLGSSRFHGNVNCAVMDAELRLHLGEKAPRTFNAALPAGDPTVFERVLDDFLRDGYRPKLVVVEVDPGTLAGRDNWLYEHALNVLDWRDVPEASLALCRNHRIIYLVRGRLLPLYLHNRQIRKEATVVLKSLLGSGHAAVRIDPPVLPAVIADPEPPPMTPVARAAMEQGGLDVGKETRDYHLQGVVTRRLERLLARCQSSGIAVLLVRVPVSSPQRRGITAEVNAAFLQYMKTLTALHGCCFTDCRDRIPDSYFRDGHHVYAEGGIYFSRRFAATELAPWWREGAYTRPLPPQQNLAGTSR